MSIHESFIPKWDKHNSVGANLSGLFAQIFYIILWLAAIIFIPLIIIRLTGSLGKGFEKTVFDGAIYIRDNGFVYNEEMLIKFIPLNLFAVLGAFLLSFAFKSNESLRLFVMWPLCLIICLIMANTGYSIGNGGALYAGRLIMALLCLPGVAVGIWLASREKRKAIKAAAILALAIVPSCKKEAKKSGDELKPQYTCGPDLKAEYLYRVYYKGILDTERICYLNGNQLGDTYLMAVDFSYPGSAKVIDYDCTTQSFTVRDTDWGSGRIYEDDSLVLMSGDYSRVFLSRKERTNYPR